MRVKALQKDDFERIADNIRTTASILEQKVS